MDIELRHRRTGAVAGIGDARRDMHRAARPQHRRVEARCTVAERRVRQPIAERIKRRIGQIDVAAGVHRVLIAGPPGRQMIVGQRHLAQRAHHGHRQMAGEIGIAEQQVAQRMASLIPAEPGVDQPLRVFGEPRQRQRPSADDHRDYRLSGRGHRLGEGELLAGQIDRGAAVALANHVHALAEDEDRHIRRLCRCHRVGDA